MIELTTPCLEFDGARLVAGGYGALRLNGKTVRAHRVAYCDAHGLKLTDILGKQVRHRCDNPPCINSDHLLLGSHTDNMRDKQERGRGNQPKGERNHKAKLDAAAVRVIRSRAAAGETNRTLGQAFRVNASQISRIVTRATWSHVE